MKSGPLRRYSPGFRQFISKTILFLALFIIISLIIGQRIETSSLLYGFGIFVYGGMGYILLFSILGFILLFRKKLFDMKSYRHRAMDWFLLFIALIFISAFYLIELVIKNITVNIINTIFVHFVFLGMFIFLTLGIYSWQFVADFYKKFKKEIISFLIFGIIAYSLMRLVWQVWPYLSFIVAKVVYFMLRAVNANNARYIPGADGIPILGVGNFAAKIAEACSGIYSIFIFTALYIFIVFIDWKKLNKTKAFSVFVPAVIGAFLVNIIRVFSLMLVGAFVSRSLALGLYHSYVGMIFFMIYFIIFWFISYKWMKK